MEIKKLYLEGKEKIKANGIACSGQETFLMISHITGDDRSKIYSHPSLIISSEQEKNFRLMINRRINGEPLSYITGEKEFYSRKFTVDPNVLIPRPETEILVEKVLESIPPRGDLKIVDLGTGSGCIGVTICLEKPFVKVLATDISYSAIKTAKKNAEKYGLQDMMFFANTDMLSCLTPGSVDIIVSNPPYISDPDFEILPSEVKNHEPQSALRGGIDGLGIIRKIIADGKSVLKSGGSCFIETGYNQAEVVSRLFESTGYYNIQTFFDLSGKERIVSAKWKE